jgi:hypothetical protein
VRPTAAGLVASTLSAPTGSRVQLTKIEVAAIIEIAAARHPCIVRMGPPFAGDTGELQREWNRSRVIVFATTPALGLTLAYTEWDSDQATVRGLQREMPGAMPEGVLRAKRPTRMFLRPLAGETEGTHVR